MLGDDTAASLCQEVVLDLPRRTTTALRYYSRPHIYVIIHHLHAINVYYNGTKQEVCLDKWFLVAALLCIGKVWYQRGGISEKTFDWIWVSSQPRSLSCLGAHRLWWWWTSLRLSCKHVIQSAHFWFVPNQIDLETNGVIWKKSCFGNNHTYWCLLSIDWTS